MTTRGQKRSNEIMTTSTSDNGAVLDMLTNDNTIPNLEERTLTDPAIAKDVRSVRIEGPASAKDQDTQISQSNDPASAKDHSKLLMTTSNTREI